MVVQYPDILGRITDLTPIAEAAHAAGALLIAVVTEPVALGLIKSPGEMGADIVVGEGQSIGVGLQFGGPYVGLFATREKYVRQMPGRLAGETVDAEGKRGFVLTLSTREQHIRREKATSNICTSSVLCALAFTVHLALLGEKGLRQLASLNHARAREVAERLAAIPGIELVNDAFFNEFTLKLPVEARPVVHAMVEKGVLGGVSLGRLYPGAERSAERPCDRGDRNGHRRGYRCVRNRAEGGGPMTVNPSGWRPTTPANEQDEAQTVTGNRALMLEEPLLFEVGSTDQSGVDFCGRAEGGDTAWRLGEDASDWSPRSQRTRSGAPLHAAVAAELRDRPRAVPARQLHDEAQPAPE